MILTVKQLQSIIDGNPVGDTFPYFGGLPEDIENHLKAVVATLRRSPLLDVEAQFDSYGSGYASYVHVFCAKSNRQSTVRRGDIDCIDGIVVYLSRLAPIATYGVEQRTKHQQLPIISRGFLENRRIRQLPNGNWSNELDEIITTLENFRFLLPSLEELREPLPFKAKIPTIFESECVFDAIFYWED
ncbi:MAG: hypothetical protein RMZ69_26425 [Nostoc sp. ChiQUE01a]|nr:hypothetical protein [Nostoc sp. ChiQUE01a]